MFDFYPIKLCNVEENLKKLSHFYEQQENGY